MELRLHREREEAPEEMAGDRGGGRHDPDAVRRGEEEPERAEGGPKPNAGGGPGAEEQGPVHGEVHAAETVVVNITARRVRIDPEAKRAQYLNRLELLIQELDAIIADPEGYEDIQLDAMDTLIKAVRLCYTIVRDVDVELLESELEELKEKSRETQAGRGTREIGYEVEEDPAE
ncbi:hypothetical protein ISS40_01060 [Candidatus Bathyarchaeota archaeon]|nr:hypothetical protein [Candidatus Bathyarchaeota archaeon]